GPYPQNACLCWSRADSTGIRWDVLQFQMDLTHVLDRDVGVLSGGELQRFAIGVVAVQK
ncbi:unnamed protein product, partial [Hapterophycus canaliculatus]